MKRHRSNRQPKRIVRIERVVEANAQAIQANTQAIQATTQLAEANAQAIQATTQLTEANAQAIQATTQLAEANAQAIQQLNSLFSEMRANQAMIQQEQDAASRDRLQLLGLIAQNSSEIKGLQTETKRILDLLLNQSNLEQ